MCGAPLETRVVEAHDPRPRLVCSECGFIFYIDPKVAVGTIVRKGEGLLLLKRSIDPGYGKWTFPGGYVDRGETLEEAAVREAEEETGVRIALGPLLCLFSYRHRGIIVIVYEASWESGEARATPEALEVKWTRPEALPWKDLAFPSTRSAFREYLLRHDLGGLVPAGWEAAPEL